MCSFYCFVALFSKALRACPFPSLTYFAGFLSQISDRGPQVIRGHAHAFFPDAIRAAKKHLCVSITIYISSNPLTTLRRAGLLDFVPLLFLKTRAMRTAARATERTGKHLSLPSFLESPFSVRALRSSRVSGWSSSSSSLSAWLSSSPPETKQSAKKQRAIEWLG